MILVDTRSLVLQKIFSRSRIIRLLSADQNQITASINETTINSIRNEVIEDVCQMLLGLKKSAICYNLTGEESPGIMPNVYPNSDPAFADKSLIESRGMFSNRNISLTPPRFYTDEGKLHLEIKDANSSRYIAESFPQSINMDTVNETYAFFSLTTHDVVLCLESNDNWRKTIFPNYKINRKAKNNEPLMVVVNQIYTKIVEELSKMFITLSVPRAEADDIIAVLTTFKPISSTNIIVSNDQDFIQLQENNYDNTQIVLQFSPLSRKLLWNLNPRAFMKEMIIRGDPVDGVPNILSPIDCLVNSSDKKQRQRAISSKKIEKWLFEPPEHFCDTPEMLERYNQNKSLIVFEYIPSDLQTEIRNAFVQARENYKHRADEIKKNFYAGVWDDLDREILFYTWK